MTPFLIFKWSYDPLDEPRHVQKTYQWNPLITDAKVSRGWEASHVMVVALSGYASENLVILRSC